MADLGQIVKDTTADDRWDASTLVGMIGATSLVIGAILLGSSALIFLNVPSFLIVVGGTLCVMLASYNFKDIIRSLPTIAAVLKASRRSPAHVALEMVRLAEFLRTKNLLELQDGTLQSLQNDKMLYEALTLVVDNAPEKEIAHLMRESITATVSRANKTAAILRKGAEVSPAMGLIGTLIGLVQMLANMDDPSTIGPAMAVALLTTFYGMLMATLLFNPLAAKVERNADEENLIHRLQMTGALSISRRENPRRLEMLLNGILPPSHHIAYFA